MRGEVTELLNRALDNNKSLFLIDFTITESNQIRIIIDGDHGVTVNDCIAVSREIEHNLDREETDFSLEVASAGVSESLVNTRQYIKNKGRKLAIKTQKGETIEGTLANVDSKEIVIQWKAREPKPIGKGKVTVQKEMVLDYKDIVEAKVIVTFN